MNISDILTKFGIPERASIIYISLLEKGDGKITDIADRTGFYRTYIYRYLPYLEEKNLIHSYLQQKQRYYKANEPSILLSLQSSLQESLTSAIAQLESKRKVRESGIFEYTRGQDAIKNAYIKQIIQAKPDETFYGYSSRKGDFPTPLLPPDIRFLREKKRIGRKLITSEERRIKKTKDPLRDVVVIPKNEALFDHQISKSIQGDTVTIINHETQETFSFTDKNFAEFERRIFETLFTRLSKNHRF